MEWNIETVGAIADRLNLTLVAHYEGLSLDLGPGLDPDDAVEVFSLHMYADNRPSSFKAEVLLVKSAAGKLFLVGSLGTNRHGRSGLFTSPDEYSYMLKNIFPLYNIDNTLSYIKNTKRLTDSFGKVQEQYLSKEVKLPHFGGDELIYQIVEKALVQMLYYTLSYRRIYTAHYDVAKMTWYKDPSYIAALQGCSAEVAEVRDGVIMLINKRHSKSYAILNGRCYIPLCGLPVINERNHVITEVNNVNNNLALSDINDYLKSDGIHIKLVCIPSTAIGPIKVVTTLATSHCFSNAKTPLSILMLEVSVDDENRQLDNVIEDVLQLVDSYYYDNLSMQYTIGEFTPPKETVARVIKPRPTAPVTNIDDFLPMGGMLPS